MEEDGAVAGLGEDMEEAEEEEEVGEIMYIGPERIAGSLHWLMARGSSTMHHSDSLRTCLQK